MLIIFTSEESHTIKYLVLTTFTSSCKISGISIVSFSSCKQANAHTADCLNPFVIVTGKSSTCACAIYSLLKARKLQIRKLLADSNRLKLLYEQT